MKESAFVRLNKDRWALFEKELKMENTIQPDRLAEIFIQLTDDLSFSRTQFPDSRTVKYLNNLSSQIHLQIYKNKKEYTNRVARFWKTELPWIMYEVRKPLFYSFLIFVVAGLAGVVSSLFDDTFVRLILGDRYVNMTLENIKKGNPTGVYEGGNQFDMFARITLNNILVSFRTFIFGVLSSIVTGFFLFYNGLMFGTFLILFYKEGQLELAAPVIMLHGTIELSSIVIAGAAGLVMGNSLLFPGTYSRFEAFKQGAYQGLKIVVGLVPFFIVAGFIESFVTRYAFMPVFLKAGIVGFSAVFMIYYFVIYPIQLHRNARGLH